MICRLWHGWTAPERADRYERLLREEIFAGIAERAIDGFQGIELRRGSRAFVRGCYQVGELTTDASS